MRTLAQLVANPDREFHVLDLVSPEDGAAGDEPAGTSGMRESSLDKQARASYRKRLLDLRETLSEAESLGDRERGQPRPRGD